VAGAAAVQVGTASFYDPRAPETIGRELAEWCRRHGVGAARELIGTLAT
jgi:dihydroorotate dehydrogenase (NAD+) catalytic subunit